VLQGGSLGYAIVDLFIIEVWISGYGEECIGSPNNNLTYTW
jgi:hypothetical protein